MTLQSIFDQYKHLDHLLSDREWLTGPDEEGHVDIRMVILFDCWQAIKAELKVNKSSRKIAKTPFRSCYECMWCYEGECNLSKQSGFQFDYDRYADDDDEHEFKPCKYRLEYCTFEDWFLENIGVVMQE